MGERSVNQDFLDELAAWLTAADEKSASENGAGEKNPPPPGSSYAPTDAEILEKCRSSQNSPKFAALYDHGDVFVYHHGDDSRADLGLLGMLAFYSQDPAQLERIFDGSRLAQRDKWRRRADYRERTIRRALSELRETYDWNRGKSRRLFSSSDSYTQGDDENNEEPEIVFFADLGEPPEREYLIEKLAVKGYPLVAFGAGGVAKSFAVLAAGIGIASASGVDSWLGLPILDHGHVLYCDFELDLHEQQRRVRDLCTGMGVPVPKRLAYLSGVGVYPHKVFGRALEFVREYSAKLVIIDSMALAMEGADMDRGKEVLAFHAKYVNVLRRAGASVFIVDHEGKLQVGEKHRDKAPIGSAFKAWASRSVLQFIFEEFREESSELDISVRHTKANFGPKIEPVGLRFTFGEKRVEMEPYALPEVELLAEESKPVKERIVAALEMDSMTVPELEKQTGATRGTIYNRLSELVSAGVVVQDSYRGRSKVYRLFSSSLDTPTHEGDDENEDPRFSSVAELFADPPGLFAAQLGEYDKDPDRHFRAVCVAATAMTREEGTPWEDVANEVREELAKRALPTVVNIRSGEPYDIYIGREYKKRGHNLEESDWHNPFVVGRDGTRVEVLEKYERYLREERPDLMRRLGELRGKRLGCWCKPDACHGDVLVRLVAESATDRAG
jgi:DNA-binding transcriptional ArsR family regulator